MQRQTLAAVIVVMTTFGGANLMAQAVPSTSAAPANERLHYSWSLKGALSWIARVAFPTSGNGTLETSSGSSVHSRLTMNAPRQKGYAFYESQMVLDGSRTLVSSDGYAWNDRKEEQHVTFDYLKGLARVEKRSSDDGVETRVRKLQDATPQDVLTSIYFLRQNAAEITAPRRAQVYSGSKSYDFIFSPRAMTTMKFGEDTVRVRPFTITPVSSHQKGEVRVWLTDDARRLPLKIEIDQKYATLKLDLRD
jgi:hypothetical protein